MGLFSFIFARGEQERSDELDRKLRELNAAAVERGRMTPEQYLEFERRLNEQPSVEEQVEEAFIEGAKEGLEKQQQAVKRTLTETVKAAVGFVPWWLWILLAVAAVAWLANTLGLFSLLKRKVSTL